jgi:hypothetical protein
MATIIVIVLVGLGVAQVALGSRTFRAVPPDLGPQPGWGPLPVTLYDATGLVAEVRVWGRPVAPGTDPLLEGALPLPDLWLRLGWLGGACADGTVLAFVEDGPGYRMVWQEQGLVLACPAIGIARAVEVRFTRLIEPGRIEVVRG